MIEEVFISTINHKVLYGNTILYPKSPKYPLHIVNNGVESKMLSQLRVNDVILSIMYSNFDAFTASKYLVDIKDELENILVRLDSTSINNQYFIVLEILQNIDILIDKNDGEIIDLDKLILEHNSRNIKNNNSKNSKINGNAIARNTISNNTTLIIDNPVSNNLITNTSTEISDTPIINSIDINIANAANETNIITNNMSSISLENLLPKRNCYINIVESLHTVISPGNKVIQNIINGSIFIDKNLSNEINDEIKMTIMKGDKYNINFKSNYIMYDDLNKIKIVKPKKENNELQDSILMTYHIQSMKEIPIRFQRVGDKYIFECDLKRKYKFIKIVIPVSATTYAAEIKATIGNATFNSEKRAVIWVIEDSIFSRENIIINAKVFETEIVKMPIMVYFNIPDWTDSGVSIGNCICSKVGTVDFWVRHTTQDEYYEIQQ